MLKGVNQIIDVELLIQLASYLCFLFITVFKIILYIVFLLLISIKKLLVSCFALYKYEYLFESLFLCAVFLFSIIYFYRIKKTDKFEELERKINKIYSLCQDNNYKISDLEDILKHFKNKK